MADKLKVGDRAEYRTRTQPTRTGTIIAIGIETGGVVFDIKLDNGCIRWGYEHQFQKIEVTA